MILKRELELLLFYIIINTIRNFLLFNNRIQRIKYKVNIVE